MSWLSQRSTFNCKTKKIWSVFRRWAIIRIDRSIGLSDMICSGWGLIDQSWWCRKTWESDNIVPLPNALMKVLNALLKVFSSSTLLVNTEENEASTPNQHIIVGYHPISRQNLAIGWRYEIWEKNMITINANGYKLGSRTMQCIVYDSLVCTICHNNIMVLTTPWC